MPKGTPKKGRRKRTAKVKEPSVEVHVANALQDLSQRVSNVRAAQKEHFFGQALGCMARASEAQAKAQLQLAELLTFAYPDPVSPSPPVPSE